MTVLTVETAVTTADKKAASMYAGGVFAAKADITHLALFVTQRDKVAAAVLERIWFWHPRAAHVDKAGVRWLIRSAQEFVDDGLPYCTVTVQRAIRRLAKAGFIQARRGPHLYGGRGVAIYWLNVKTDAAFVYNSTVRPFRNARGVRFLYTGELTGENTGNIAADAAGVDLADAKIAGWKESEKKKTKNTKKNDSDSDSESPPAGGRKSAASCTAKPPVTKGPHKQRRPIDPVLGAKALAHGAVTEAQLKTQEIQVKHVGPQLGGYPAAGETTAQPEPIAPTPSPTPKPMPPAKAPTPKTPPPDDEDPKPNRKTPVHAAPPAMTPAEPPPAGASSTGAPKTAEAILKAFEMKKAAGYTPSPGKALNATQLHYVFRDAYRAAYPGEIVPEPEPKRLKWLNLALKRLREVGMSDDKIMAAVKAAITDYEVFRDMVKSRIGWKLPERPTHLMVLQQADQLREFLVQNAGHGGKPLKKMKSAAQYIAEMEAKGFTL